MTIRVTVTIWGVIIMSGDSIIEDPIKDSAIGEFLSEHENFHELYQIEIDSGKIRARYDTEKGRTTANVKNDLIYLI